MHITCLFLKSKSLQQKIIVGFHTIKEPNTLTSEKLLQLICNRHFNEESTSFLNTSTTNVAVSINIFAIISLAVTTKVMLDNVSLHSARKFKKLLCRCLAIVRPGQWASITASKSLNASRVSLCLNTKDNNNTTLVLLLIGAPE